MIVKVLFVCLGNICRSPTAHGLFQAEVEKARLGDRIFVDSAGTSGWHIGSPPDPRSQKTALDRGYDISHLRGREVELADFEHFDYILGMDRKNLADLSRLRPAGYNGNLGLFLEVAGVGEGLDVPDPYAYGQEHFDKVIQLVQAGVSGLLARIRSEHGF